MKKNSNFPTTVNKNASKAKQKHEQFPESEFQFLLSRSAAKVRQVSCLTTCILVELARMAAWAFPSNEHLVALCFCTAPCRGFLSLGPREKPVVHTCLLEKVMGNNLYMRWGVEKRFIHKNFWASTVCQALCEQLDRAGWAQGDRGPLLETDLKQGAAAQPQCTVADAVMLTRKTEGCRGWTESYPQNTVKSCSPAPVSMALFGNRIFADVVKLTMRSLGWTLSHCDWSLCKTRGDAEADSHGEMAGAPGRTVLTDAETWCFYEPGTPRTVSRPRS